MSFQDTAASVIPGMLGRFKLKSSKTKHPSQQSTIEATPAADTFTASGKAAQRQSMAVAEQSAVQSEEVKLSSEARKKIEEFNEQLERAADLAKQGYVKDAHEALKESPRRPRADGTFESDSEALASQIEQKPTLTGASTQSATSHARRKALIPGQTQGPLLPASGEAPKKAPPPPLPPRKTLPLAGTTQGASVPKSDFDVV